MLSRSLAYLITALGLLLAIFSPTVWAQGLFAVEILAALLGFLCFLYPPLARSRCNPPLGVSKGSTLRQDLGLLFFGQISLIFFSGVFFDTLELQTRLSPSLQELEPGFFFLLLKNNYIRLGVIPWIVYAILGVGLCYLSTASQRNAYLPKVIIPNHRKQPLAFIYNFLCVVTESSATCPIIFVTGFTLIYLCETIKGSFGWSSLFKTPYLALFVMGLLMLGSRNLKNRLIDQMIQYRLSVGNVLILYILVISLLLITMHNIGEGFFPNNQGVQLQALQKSSITGSFSESRLQLRLMLLFLGWWAIWTPWMATFVARYTVGRKVGWAFVSVLFLPSLIFCVLIPSLSLEQWLNFSHWIQIPSVKVILAMLLLFFIWLLWGKMYTTGDISRGAMLSWGRSRSSPLKKWMVGFLLWLSCFLPTWFMSGWVPIQIFSSMSACFILVLLITFLISLIRALLPKDVSAFEYN